MIYFVRRPGGAIKIGTTIRLSTRIKELAVEYGEGLKVLAVADGGRTVEASLHRRFSHLRKEGEWFRPGRDLLRFLKTEARRWDGQDERELLPLQIDPKVALEAKYLAIEERVTLSEFVNRVLAESVDGPYQAMRARLAQEAGVR